MRSAATLSRLAILLALLALPLTPDPAAADPEMEVVEVAFPVKTVFPGEGPVRKVAISAGVEDGVVVGWRGDAHAVRSGEEEKHLNAQALGRAEVLSVKRDLSIVRVTLSDPSGPTVVKVGDVVELRVRVPKIAPRSVLFHLTRFGIRLTGTEHPTPYFTYRDLYAGESREMIGRLMEEMVERVRQSGRDYGHVKELRPRITKGRYRGRIPADVLVEATAADLETFFQFVLNYPGKYYGHEWDVDEIFATWVINNAPPSLEEVVAELLAKTDADEVAAVVARHIIDRTDVALDDIPGRLRSAAEDTAREGEIERAWRYLDFAIAASEIIANPRDFLWLDFTRAWILDQAGRLEESIAAYRGAIEVFESAGSIGLDGRWGVAQCLHNLGYGLQQSGDYKGALSAYEKSLAMKEELDANRQSRGLTNRVIGDLLQKLGRYTDAVERHRRAQELFASLDAREGLTDALKGEAEALAALGRNDEAALVYRTLLVEHRRVGDRAREASTLDEIGTQHWKLGDYAASREAIVAAIEIYRELGNRGGEAIALDNMGRLHVNLGEFDEARKWFVAAVEMERELGRRDCEADALTDLGDLAGKTGDYSLALEYFEEALAIAREISDRSSEAYVEGELGDLRHDRKEFELAIAAYSRAIELHRESGANADLAGDLRRRGRVYIVLKEFPKAWADLEEALRIGRNALAPSLQADVLIEMSWLHWHRLEHAKAIETAGKALDLARAIGNRRLEATCLRRQSEVMRTVVRFDEALERAREALAVLEASDLSDPVEVSRTRVAIGDVYSSRGSFLAAEREFKTALKAAADCGARAEQLTALLRIGDMLLLRGDLVGAESFYSKGSSISVDNAWLRTEAVGRLAILADETGEPGRAIELRREVVDVQRSLRNDWALAQALNGLAHTLFLYGDAEAAREIAVKAVALAEEHADRGTQAVAHATAGQIDAELGDFDAALDHFTFALDVFTALEDPYSIADTQLYIARLHLAVDTEEARELAAEALIEARGKFREIGAALKEAEVGTEQARLALARGRTKEASALLDGVSELAERTGSPRVLWNLHFLSSRVADRLDQLDVALTEIRAAIAILEKVRGGLGADERAQREFLRSRVSVYESMAELLGRVVEVEKDPERKKQLIDEAFEFISRARFEILSEGARDLTGTGSERQDELLAKLSQARRDVARLTGDIEKARAEGNTGLERELTKVLATNLEELAELHANLTAADRDLGSRLKFDPRYLDMVDAMPEGARLVVYFTGVNHLFFWVFSPEGFVTWKRHEIGREEIGRLVGEYRDRMDEVIEESRVSKGRGFGPEAEESEGNPEWYRANARATRLVLEKLYRSLIGPVEGEIAGADPLLIVPYGRLNYLPFEALIDAGGRFLGERQRITYFVHGEHLKRTLLRLYHPAAKKDDVWVAFADPVGHLAESLEEVAEIQALFPEHEVHTRLTGTATEGSLKEIRADGTILHFATHGFLNGTKPSDTWLELASPPGDGRLMQKEIWPRMKREVPPLKARNIRLVVLSACDTARAQKSPEAEVLGMPDAFTMAGSPAVLASLWPVHSWSTTDLMVEFYRRVANEKADLGTALLGARRAMLENRATGRYAHPYYWSAFLLFGDWR